jgi:hypothetical protein
MGGVAAMSGSKLTSVVAVLVRIVEERGGVMSFGESYSPTRFEEPTRVDDEARR